MIIFFYILNDILSYIKAILYYSLYIFIIKMSLILLLIFIILFNFKISILLCLGYAENYSVQNHKIKRLNNYKFNLIHQE